MIFRSTAVALNRHPGMFLAGIQCLSIREKGSMRKQNHSQLSPTTLCFVLFHYFSKIKAKPHILTKDMPG